MKQSTINDFFKGNNQLSKKITKKKLKFIVKSNLNINIDTAKQILNMLPNMIEELYIHYKEKDDYKPMHLMKKHFDIFYENEVLELISLFERPIPYQRKYYKRLAKEFYLIKEKTFFEVFKQVKEILNMTKQYPHIIRGSAGCSLVCYLMKIHKLLKLC